METGNKRVYLMRGLPGQLLDTSALTIYFRQATPRFANRVIKCTAAQHLAQFSSRRDALQTLRRRGERSVSGDPADRILITDPVDRRHVDRVNARMPDTQLARLQDHQAPDLFEVGVRLAVLTAPDVGDGRVGAG
ncbi:MAG: hypothetical protein QF805_30650 [Pirellulaceae bacterium]|jgi:hypothetical protein|nr:hypothetical protein [Pirellulaceae bacterium]